MEAAGVARRFGDAHITSIYTSDLKRARETADIVGRALGLVPEIDPALRERNFGQAQGRPHGELVSAVSGIERNRVVDADARPEEGESLSELYNRVRDFIDRIGDVRTGGRCPRGHARGCDPGRPGLLQRHRSRGHGLGSRSPTRACGGSSADPIRVSCSRAVERSEANATNHVATTPEVQQAES